jgi:hypothetical protein
MNIIKLVMAVVATIVISVPAMANTWESSANENGGIAFIASERFKNTAMGVFVEATNDCQARLVIMDTLTVEESKDLYIGKQFGKIRVDGGQIWTNEKVFTYRDKRSDSGNLFNSLTTLDDGDELLKELQSGNNVIVKIAKQQSDKFSLSGFTKTYYEAVSLCGKILLEKDEWSTSNVKDGEWEV